MSRMARDHGGRARRKDGAMANEEVRAGRCHCGAVRFNVRLADGLTSARRCDCSYCAARGAVAVTAMRGDLKVTDGADADEKFVTYEVTYKVRIGLIGDFGRGVGMAPSDW